MKRKAEDPTSTAHLAARTLLQAVRVVVSDQRRRLLTRLGLLLLVSPFAPSPAPATAYLVYAGASAGGASETLTSSTQPALSAHAADSTTYHDGILSSAESAYADLSTARLGVFSIVSSYEGVSHPAEAQAQYQETLNFNIPGLTAGRKATIGIEVFARG